MYQQNISIRRYSDPRARMPSLTDDWLDRPYRLADEGMEKGMADSSRYRGWYGEIGS